MRDGPVKGDIFKRHMRAAIKRGRDARIAANDHDLVFGITDGQKDLVKTAARSERTKCVYKRTQTGSRQSGGDAHHVCLGNTGVECLVRVVAGPFFGTDGAHQIGVEIDEIRFITQAFDGGAEGILHRPCLSLISISKINQHTAPPFPASCSWLTSTSASRS